MKFRVKELKSKPGFYAVFEDKTTYLTNTVTADKKQAQAEALRETARWHQAQIDLIDQKLDKMGELDHADPHGYLC